jgi:PAS domain S-box-containing protein
VTKKVAGAAYGVDSSTPSTGSGQSGSGPALRKRAEALAAERAAVVPHDLDALTPGEFERTLHELRVHQIELEIQNEELRLTQAELEASRSRYFDLYDLAPVGYFALNEQGLITKANLTVTKLLGVTRSALVKHPLTHFVLPEDQDTNYLNFKKLIETGGLRVWEMRLVRKGAAPFWTRVEAVKVREVDGASVCRVVVSDITETNRVREELLNAHRRTTAILESISDGFTTLDREWSFTYVNPPAAKMMGKKPEELLGRNLWEQWPHAAESPVGVALHRAVAENVPVQAEAFYPEPLNAWFEVRCYPWPEGLSLFFTDITPRRRLEEEREQTARVLESAVAEKTVLLREIHHRVKNNLAVIASLLSMGADSTVSAEAKTALGESQQRVYSMALIHEHLYGTSHLDRINFSEYAGQLASGLFSALVAEPGRISLVMDVDPIEIGIERAVPCALIINELLSNAFKYAFPDGRSGKVRVSLHEREAESLELRIEDDGIGLPAGRLLEPNTKSLGLRIIRILTKQLEGSIEQQAGPGTRILLRFRRVIGNNNG